MIPSERAETAAMHGLLNCYLRETAAWTLRPAGEVPIDCDAEQVASVPFEQREKRLYAPVAYRSPTGRHQFDLPAVTERPDGSLLATTTVGLANAIATELRESREGADATTALVERVLRSKRNVERFVRARRDDTEDLYAPDTSFRAAEQSLVFGHRMHPTPKSRQGIEPHERATYAPELRGSFQLHYVAADPALVEYGSARQQPAPALVEATLRADETVDDAVRREYVDGERVLLPLHPWQARHLREQASVRHHRGAGLEYLGPLGSAFYPTSSVRTLYSPDAPFMVKGSLAVEITNSERVIQRRELDRGVAVCELLDAGLGATLREEFPSFEILRDPAYLTVDVGPDGDGDEASGFETILRENPFRGEDATATATPVVALCQDHVDGGRSRLRRTVEAIAEREGRSLAAVSADWFERYLAVTVRPILWLYLEHGLGLEAHQQNTVLVLDGGYPDRSYYRDSQGFFFPESRYERVAALLPGIGERTGTVRPDDLTDEAITYYVFLNNVFGLINAFGTAGLVDEQRLLSLVRRDLEALRRYDHEGSSVLTDLLAAEQLTCKANLLMRFHDVDELTGSVEDQIVTTPVDNPLVTEL